MNVKPTIYSESASMAIRIWRLCCSMRVSRGIPDAKNFRLTNTKSFRGSMERVVLMAKVDQIEDKYVARIDDVGLVGEGETLEAAQDELIQVTRAWIESHDSTDTLSGVLADAGYPGVDEETELQLEFIEAALFTESVETE